MNQNLIRNNNGKLTVHFSVDDVGQCFRYAYDHNVRSLFDVPEYAFLMELHNDYGICCSCYIFEPTDFFEFAMENKSIKGDFIDNKWLRFGFHGNKVPFQKDWSVRSEYYLFEHTCNLLGAEMTDIIRLHNWYATETQKAFLKSKGITTLLYPNDICLKYDENDEFYADGLLHKKTNVRIEMLDEINEQNLQIGIKDHIVIFTHEKDLLTLRKKIYKVIRLFCRNGYTFV